MFLPLFSVCFLLASCQRDEIQTYSIPKELPSPQPSPIGRGRSEATGEGEVTWKVPAGWKEQAPNSMRLASFLIKGENGQEADMSVVTLSGEAGGDLANINRWRGQIQLGAMSQPDLSAQSETLKAGGRKMLYVDFVKGKKRLMAAIYHQKDQTWFFKILGEDATVLSAKPAFMHFLQSLKFHDE